MVTWPRTAASDSRQPFAQLLDDALAVAGGLREAGVAPGETVALIVPGAREFLTTFLGAACAGVVPAPLYPPVRLDQFEAYLRQTTPAVRASRRGGRGDDRAVAAGARHAPVGRAERPVGAGDRAAAGPRASPRSHRVRLDDPVFLQFTSGSTSDPKGVVLTHRNLAENVGAIAGPHGLAPHRPDDRGVSWLPLFHDMGLIGMALTVLYVGCTTDFLSPLAFLKRPGTWLRAISRTRATISFAPNFAYDLCVRRVQPREMADLDLSCWRVAGCGAEPVRAETLAAFADEVRGGRLPRGGVPAVLRHGGAHAGRRRSRPLNRAAARGRRAGGRARDGAAGGAASDGGARGATTTRQLRAAVPRPRDPDRRPEGPAAARAARRADPAEGAVGLPRLPRSRGADRARRWPAAGCTPATSATSPAASSSSAAA